MHYQWSVLVLIACATPNPSATAQSPFGLSRPKSQPQKPPGNPSPVIKKLEDELSQLKKDIFTTSATNEALEKELDQNEKSCKKSLNPLSQQYENEIKALNTRDEWLKKLELSSPFGIKKRISDLLKEIELENLKLELSRGYINLQVSRKNLGYGNQCEKLKPYFRLGNITNLASPNLLELYQVNKEISPEDVQVLKLKTEVAESKLILEEFKDKKSNLETALTSQRGVCNKKLSDLEDIIAKGKAALDDKTMPTIEEIKKQIKAYGSVTSEEKRELNKVENKFKGLQKDIDKNRQELRNFKEDIDCYNALAGLHL